MGQRSTTETVVAIAQAFLEQRTWTQAALADHVKVNVPALRKRLAELKAHGFPLTREEEHPHVLWSVAKDWFPGAVAFEARDALDLLRLLGRLPRSAARGRFVRRILAAAPGGPLAAADAPAVITPEPTEREELYLPLAEDAYGRKVALRFHYFTVSRGVLEWRHASVQQVHVGQPARFIAVCHRDGKLKWFRLDNVLGGSLDAGEPYRPAAAGAVDALLRESIDGFHQGGDPIRCTFMVREPESRWVERNLPSPMDVEPVPGGCRFSTATSGMLRLARFVAGLGGAARVETPELALLVAELARGTLASAAAAAGDGQG